jgi:hypothetical protein
MPAWNTLLTLPPRLLPHLDGSKNLAKFEHF